MPRFFIEPDQVTEDTLLIEGNDAYHIARALRMAVGDALIVCDTEGTEYDCRLTLIRDDRAECRILSRKPGETEPPLAVTLYMAWPKGDKADTVVQKAVELGVRTVCFFTSERCVDRPKPDRLPHRLERLRRIAREAAGQSGRSALPRVADPLSFADALARAGNGACLFCYEGERTLSIRAALESLPKETKEISVFVGSEGGFSKAEAEQAGRAGCTVVHLGRRILRCETAPGVALAAILYRFEW